MKQQMTMNDVVSHFVSFFSIYRILFPFSQSLKFIKSLLFICIYRTEAVATYIFKIYSSSFFVCRFVCLLPYMYMQSIWSDLRIPSSSNSIKERFPENHNAQRLFLIPGHFLSLVKCLFSTSSSHTNAIHFECVQFRF